MKFDFDERIRMEELATEDPETLAEMVVTLEIKLRRCRAETLREAERRVDEIDDYPEGYIGHADAMDAVYVQVRDLLVRMADEAEKNDERSDS